MQLTKNFTLEEFACKDGTYPQGSHLINIKELAANLQVLRDYVGKPVRLNSAYRSMKHNEKIGGEKLSFHLIGKAGDITIDGMTPKQVAATIEKLIEEGKMKQGGLGTYKTFVHYDTRGKRARWQKL